MHGENLINNDHFQGDHKTSDTHDQQGLHESNIIDTQSEFEKVNAENDPEYDLNYPPLTKWARDHPQIQVLGDTILRVLT